MSASKKGVRNGILSLAIKDKAVLYSAYMPFLENGGLFVPTNKSYSIGDDVFIGSDTQLVAPVTIANGVTIGAGTTVTKDVDENQLSISRAKQITINDWKRPKKGDKKS